MDALEITLRKIPHDYREMVALGLEYRGTCQHCGDPICRVEWPANKTSCCQKPHTLNPEPEVQEAYQVWADEVDTYVADYQHRSGTGDWENHEIFQLRSDDPLRYEAKSLADYNAILRKRGYDPDTHRPDLTSPKWGLVKEQ